MPAPDYFVPESIESPNTAEGTFRKIFNRVLKIEKGYTNDSGGPTNFGVTQTALDAWRKSKNLPLKSVKDIDVEEAYHVANEEYFQKPKIDLLPESTADAIFDFGYNASPRKAISSLQEVIGAKADGIIGNETLGKLNDYINTYGEKPLIKNIIEKQQSHYNKLIKDNPDKYQKYENGWNNRIKGLKEYFDISMLNPFAVKEAKADVIEAPDYFEPESMKIPDYFEPVKTESAMSGNKPEPTFISNDTSNKFLKTLSNTFRQPLYAGVPLFGAMSLLTKKSPEQEIAKSQNIYQLSKATGLPIQEVSKNYEALARTSKITGMNPDQPSNKEYMAGLLTAPIIAGAVSNPGGTVAGMIAFGVLNKLIPTEKFIPEDASDEVKTTIELADFIAKGAIVGGVFKKSPALLEKFTKNKLTEYNLPKEIKLSAEQVKDIFQTGKLTTPEEVSLFGSLGLKGSELKSAVEKGVKINIPAEKLIRLTDKPYWAKIKSAIGIKPREIITKDYAGKAAKAPEGLLDFTEQAQYEQALQSKELLQPRRVALDFPLHPAPKADVVEGRTPDEIKAFNDRQDVLKMMSYESSQEGGKRIRTEEGDWLGIQSGHSQAMQEIGPQKSFEIMNKFLNNEELTPKEIENLSLLLDDFRSNVKSSMPEFEVEESSVFEKQSEYKPLPTEGKVVLSEAEQSIADEIALLTKKDLKVDPRNGRNKADDIGAVLEPNSPLEKIFKEKIAKLEGRKLSSTTAQDPLIQEARKYKSAEEFVRAKINVEKGNTYQILQNLIKEIPVKEFGLEGNIQFAETPVNKDKVNEYIKRIESGERPPVIWGNLSEAEFTKLVDGRHRFEAYKKLGFQKIPSIYTGELTDIWNKAQEGVEAKEGTPLERQQKESYTIEEKEKAYGSVAKAKKTIEETGKDISNVRTRSSSLPIKRISKIEKELQSRGFVDYRGKQVNNIQEIAEVISAFRHPKIEQYQFLFIKGNTVVAHQVLSSGLPGYASFNDKLIYHIGEVAKKLGADSIYFAHNHPSGNSNPSFLDRDSTLLLNKKLGNKFKGHIVTNGDSFSVINSDIYKNTTTVKKHSYSKESFREGFARVIPHSQFEGVIAKIGKDFIDKGKSAIIFLDSNLNILSVDNVGIQKNIPQYIKESMMRYGATRYIVTYNQGNLPNVQQYPKGFLDIVRMNQDKTYSSFEMGERDALPSGSTIQQKELVKEGFYRIQEEETPLSLTEQNPENTEKFKQFKKKADSLWGKAVEKIQDDWYRVKALVNQKGANVTETNNPYEAEIRYWGRLGTRIEEAVKIAEGIEKDIIQSAKKLDISDRDLKKDINNYLVAVHAPERNAALGQRAAGIDNEEAQVIISDINSRKNSEDIKRIAKQISDLNKKTLDVLLESGVISREFYDTLRAKYPNHIPLNRIIPTEEGQDIVNVLTSRGLDVRGTGIKRAKGSELEIADIMTNVISNYASAVSKAEKNIVDNYTLRFARDNEYFDGLFEEVRPPMVPVAQITHKEAIDQQFFNQVIEFAQSLGARVYTKGQPGRNLGYFRPSTEVTRRVATPREVLSHEVGHFFDNKFKLKERFYKRGATKAVAEEMLKWMKTIGESPSRMKKTAERFADAFEWWLTNRALAEESLPLFSEKMQGIINEIPELKPLLDIKPSGGFTIQGIKEVIFRPSVDKLLRDPNILSLFENGKATYLKINDKNLAAALRGINRQKVDGLLKFAQVFTRFYSGLQTRFNPEFALPNMIRDIQEVIVYLASKGEMGFKGALKTPTKEVSSMKDILDSILNKETPGAKLYKQLRMDGGTTGGMALSTRQQVELNLEQIEKDLKSKPRQAAQTILRMVDNWNTIFEDATRLSVYRTALEQGLSRDKAAVLAKEASVNFNKLGAFGPTINSLYMFSNASIQGSAKMLKALKNPKTASMVALIIASAVLLASKHNERIDPEWRKKVSKWDRLNGINILLPTNQGIRYFTIPVSWGLKPMKVAFDYANDYLDGEGEGLISATSAVFSSFIDAFNPVGGTDFISSITPTILDLPVDIARNKSWSGGKIRPDWDPSAPASIKYFKNLRNKVSGKAIIAATKTLSDRGIEISPADVNYAFESIVGGSGRTITKVFNTVMGLTKGGLKAREIPFASRFYRQLNEDEIRTYGKDYIEVQSLLKKQKKESFYLGQEAELILKDFENLSGEERNRRAAFVKKEDPLLYEKLIELDKEKKKGLGYSERQIKQLGVENGFRANYIYKKMMELPAHQRNAYIKDLQNKGIVSKEVLRQLKQKHKAMNNPIFEGSTTPSYFIPE